MSAAMPVEPVPSRPLPAGTFGAGMFRPQPAPAPATARILAQARFDTRVFLRNGEQLLLTLVLPALLLAALALTDVLDLGPGRRVDVATPGVLTLAVMSTAFTGQAISTGFDRRYGVLRLLAVSPLGRAGLLGGRVLAVLAVEVLQIVLLGGLGLALGWQPELGMLPLAVLAVLVGTGAFVSLGLLLAGTLRAEAVLAAANLIWVLLLAGGGVIIPSERLGPVGAIAQWLPSGALGDLLRSTLLDGTADWQALAALLGWTAVGCAATVRWFRWD